MNQLTNLLYWISTGLMIPVILLLLLFFVRSFLQLGAFYALYTQKLKLGKNFNQILNTYTTGNIDKELEKVPVNNKLLISIYLQKVQQLPKSEAHHNKLLNDFEVDCQKEMSGAQVLAKIAPVLGLMGTLIPMGPALVGLSTGDIESMAGNMQVAFATTVTGLFAGAIGFIILQVKRRWFATDLNNLEFISNLILSGVEKTETPKAKKTEPIVAEPVVEVTHI